MIDAAKVKEMLNDKAEDVCRFLLPAGIREREEWCVGDVNNTAGKSLRVHLSGSKIGVWCDFQEAGYRGSNLLALWMAVRCPGDFKKAITEAKEWLGLREDTFKRVTASPDPEKKNAPLPQDWKDQVCDLDPAGPVFDYLHNQRKLSVNALEAYKVQQSKDDKYIVFPSYDDDNNLICAKFLAIVRNEDGKKSMFVLPKGARKILFGIQAVPDKAQEVCLTEGEIDAVTMWDYGLPAVSVPFGAKWPGSDGHDPNSEWIEHGFDWLERFLQIDICMDADEPGIKAAYAIAPRLGRERCLRIEWPAEHKDANGCRLAGLEPDDIFDLLFAAKNFDPPELKKPSDLKKELWEQYYPTGDKEPGEETPWALPFLFRPGEVTVWQGYAKHGKTVAIDFCMTNLAARYGIKSCRASLEIPGKKTLQNTGRQIMGKRKPQDEKEFNRLVDWMDRFFWIYDHVGEAAPDRLLEVLRYVAKKYGVKHFVLDSLMRIAIDEEDVKRIKAFMNELCAFAIEFGAHIHIVAHSKKPDSKHPEEKCWPSKYDVKGFSEIVNIAGNIVCVWRNKAKEKQLYDLEDMPDDDDKYMKMKSALAMNDALFVVQGQRGGDGEEPIKQLWYDHDESWQFFDRPDWTRVSYLNGDKPWENR